MKKRTRSIIVFCVAIIIMIIATIVAVNIYRNNYFKSHWDTRKNTEKELRDYQTYWISEGVLLKVDGGYYIIKDSEDNRYKYICYWDGVSEGYEIICDKANCNHDSMDCQGCLSGHVSCVQYSNGYLFYKDENSEGDVFLYRCNADGTNRCPMLKIADGDKMVPDIKVYVHGNDVFVKTLTIEEEYTEGKIIHYDMTKKNPEECYKEVCNNTEDRGQVYVEDVLGDEMLYSVFKQDCVEICEYDIKNNTSRVIECLTEGLGKVDYVGDSIMYYGGGKVVLLKNRNPQEKVYLAEGQYYHIGNDGKYIFVDNVPVYTDAEETRNAKHCVKVFDLNGKELYTLDMPEGTKEKMQVCFFGDEKNMFVTNFSDTEVYVMDKTDIANGKWKLINMKK